MFVFLLFSIACSADQIIAYFEASHKLGRPRVVMALHLFVGIRQRVTSSFNCIAIPRIVSPPVVLEHDPIVVSVLL